MDRCAFSGSRSTSFASSPQRWKQPSNSIFQSRQSTRQKPPIPFGRGVSVQPCCHWGDLTGLIYQVFDLGRPEFRAGDPDAWLGRGIADGRALLVGIGESGCFVTTSETAERETRDKPRTHLSPSAARRGGESRPSDRSAARRASVRLLQRESSACAGVNQEHLICLAG